MSGEVTCDVKVGCFDVRGEGKAATMVMDGYRGDAIVESWMMAVNILPRSQSSKVPRFLPNGPQTG